MLPAREAEIDLLNQKAFQERNTHPEKSFENAQQALQLSEQKNYLKGKADALCNIGFHYLQITEHEKSLETLLQALELHDQAGDEAGIANAQYNLATLQIRYANFSLALDALRKSIVIREKLGDESGLASCYFQMMYINDMFGQYEEGIELGEKALAIRRAQKDRFGEAAMLTLLGGIYRKKKEYGKARSLFEESMKLRGPEDEIRGYFATVFHYVELHLDCLELEKGEEWALIGLNAALGAKEWFGIMRFQQQLGKIAMQKGDFEEAMEFYSQALSLAEERKFKSITYEICELLARLYQRRGDYKQAFEYYEKFHKLKEEVLDAQSNSQLKSIQLMNRIETSRKEAELERVKNVDLKNAFLLIEEKNKEITDSINYARRIQDGILPSETELRKCFSDYFVCYKPKDIVAGDFYWCLRTTLSGSDKQLSVIAAVDCTGHGVPGAFMSLIGHTLLNQTAKNPEINSPADVLNFLNHELPHTLKSRVGERNLRDGMDMSLCAIDFKNLKLFYAGANNPLWLVRKGELIEFRPDKQAITASDEMEKRPFGEQEFDLQKGDLIYLFTDGFADQFGGPKGKKFKYKPFGETLVSLSSLSMEAQQESLSRQFDEWKGALEQVDDVLVIGIRI